jgi:hypothetical protein
MSTLKWTDPMVAARGLYNDLTGGLFDNHRYSHSSAWQPALATIIAFTYALYILSNPPPTPRYRKLSIALLAVPVTYAFIHQKTISVSTSVCDTFGRFLYIWFANMSYEMTILEYTPPDLKENDGWKSKLKQAYKVLFARAHTEFLTKGIPPRCKRHTYSKRKFLIRHAITACSLYIAQSLYTTLTSYYISSHPVYGPDKAIFFRRLPDSLNAAELWDRFDLTIHWCIINMWMYETYHSAFAIFFVGLGFDAPTDWAMSLFGPISEAWSVRRYWGKHWHDYIYHSFSGHTKIVTRQWLGMRQGLLRRLVENTMVFGVSGVMHTAVRYAQHGETGDYWCITFWYLGQMIPIIIEGVVLDLWKRAKFELGIKDSKWLGRAEKTVGYAWVIAFNMWSVAKYVHTRNDWADKAWRKKYAKELAEYQRMKALNETKMRGEAGTEDKSEL